MLRPLEAARLEGGRIPRVTWTSIVSEVREGRGREGRGGEGRGGEGRGGRDTLHLCNNAACLVPYILCNLFVAYLVMLSQLSNLFCIAVPPVYKVVSRGREGEREE